MSAKKEESHKREINRDGEKEDRNKKLRKAESKENIPVSVEKKQVLILNYLLIFSYEYQQYINLFSRHLNPLVQVKQMNVEYLEKKVLHLLHRLCVKIVKMKIKKII